ncbi:MOG interacting and ectopic P-granules protein 1 isoform X2 [Anopheles bellator]|uniref:MOG interacting and ectopic P-granules protein 1 isoform X2 n=1 Tax=Anopheles bellator TaxID=139047 RepID=UPI002647A00E|nr:MOG interacting and ectopic P-granules protein 1 isoform X2 [Anopheles bellator]
MGAGGAAGVLMTGAGSNFAKVVPPSLTPVTPLLPALTDDMFVLEAPSFIVPYIYEKPPVDNLRDIVDDLEVKIKEMRKTLEEAGGSVDPHGVETADAAESPDKKDAASNQQTAAAADASATAEASAPDTAEKAPADTSRKRKRPTDDDDEWDELDTSTDDEASDEEQKTKVLIKEVKADIESHIILPSSEKDVLGGGGSGVGSGSTAGGGDAKKSENYFENPLGKFFMNIGINLVQEFVQTDLLRQQKRKRDREGKPSPSTQLAINSLMKNLEQSKENNKPYKFEVKRCEYCPFRSESSLVMAHHYETPHMRNFVYKCNFCAYETRPPHDILFHMEAVHNIKGRMEKALSYHHCPNCLFEDNGKSKLARHAVACAKKFRPEINLNPPVDWEPPAKIPRIKPKHGLVGTATAYQAMTAQQQKNLALANQQRINQQHVQQSVQLTQQHLAAHQALQQQQQQHAQSLAAAQQHLGIVSVNAANVNNLANLSPAAQAAAMRARAVGSGGAGNMGGVGRAPSIIPSPTGITAAAAASLRTAGGAGVNVAAAASAAIRNTLAGAGMNVSNMKTTKTAQPPSISITPLPRQSSSSSANMANIAGALSKLQSQGTAVKPGQIPGGGKTAFVVCEICDGYIKDLDQLRNHMQWIHKVKIHPKMIYNRPPLNCQKCQYRFFTDQGLERHLLGSHGLVTSSMQEAANKGKDAGRCPVCGRVYQWKLLNHVSRDHSMTLKPAHLSYKCTVCTATFGMYKQFESHVYSAHSTVAKKTVDSKGKGGGNVQQSAMNLIGNSAASSAGSGTSSSGMRGSGGGDSLLKPLKINDEITIIPQPTSNSSKMMKTIELESHVID